MRESIKSLYGLRALSIIMVVFSHIRYQSFMHISTTFPYGIFSDGAMGVNFFLIISGFLITKLLIDEENNNQYVNIKFFYIRRVLRIFPAYYFLLFCYFIFQAFNILHINSSSWMSSIFYYKYFELTDWQTSHLWSLSVEEHFYLFWPLIFKYAKKQRSIFCIGTIFIVIIHKIFVYVFNYTDAHFVSAGETLIMRLDALMIGCLIALNWPLIINFIKTHKFPKFTPIIILILISFLSSDIPQQLATAYHLKLGKLFVPLGIGNSYGLVVNLLFGLLMIYSITSVDLWVNFLNNKVLVYIGKLSYSIYLWQQFFLSKFQIFYDSFPLNILGILVMAMFSYYLIEKPVLKFKDRYNYY